MQIVSELRIPNVPCGTKASDSEMWQQLPGNKGSPFDHLLVHIPEYSLFSSLTEEKGLFFLVLSIHSSAKQSSAWGGECWGKKMGDLASLSWVECC